MTGWTTTKEPVVLPGRHVDESSPAGWLARRINPLSFLQTMLIVCLALVVWPSVFGGNFGMVIVAGDSMEPTYQLGDAVITWRQPVEVGDVVLFRVPEGEPGERNPVIHRVIGGDPSGWITQGDNSPIEDMWEPSSKDVLGVAQIKIPLGGRVLAVMRSWLFIALLGGIGAALLFWPDSEDEDQRPGKHKPER